LVFYTPIEVGVSRMSVRLAGTWIAGLSLVLAAVSGAIFGLSNGSEALQPMAWPMTILLLAAVLAAVGIVPTFTPVLWEGKQGNGTEDAPGRVITRLTSTGLVGFAGLLLLVGAGAMIMIIASAMS
jgi:hypothetical protein